MPDQGEPSGRSRGSAEGSRGRGKGRGGRGRRGRGDNGAGRVVGPDRSTNLAARFTGSTAADGLPPVSSRAQVLKQQTQAAAAAAAAVNDEQQDADVCFICANLVAHYSIATCNHATCHICGLRMRALYKTKDCAHCRTSAPFVIFTNDPNKRFEQYSDSDVTTIDSNIGIKYVNEDIVGDTVLLLRYNCPDDACDFAGLGWPDLHRHVKSIHKKRMCDLCTRNKKVFTHEHELFSDKGLEKHMRHGDDKPGAADQTGFKGHPLCGFCGERFYDDDKLFEHCRMKHERCFICDRRDSRTPHYYQDYNALEEHFRTDHFLCSNSDCLEKKFVVFESELDLQAHGLSEHAGRAVGRDARLVDMSSFDLRQSYQNERRSQRDGQGRGRVRRGGTRGRDPNEDVVPPTSTQPLRRDELALQRQLAIHSAQSVSNRSFGGQLSAPPHSTPPPTTTIPSGRAVSPNSNAAQDGIALVDAMDSFASTDSPNLSPEDRARLVRHSSVVERAANLLGNDANKVTTFRQHISRYRQGGLTAPQLADAFLTLFADVSSNSLGTLVREVADLFEDKVKADNIRKAWQDWRAINEDYPSLPGLSGMQGTTSSSSGWAHAAAANPGLPNAAPAQRHSNRVLRLKNSTRLGGPTPVNVSVSPSRTTSPATKPQQQTSPSAFPSLPSGPGSGPSSGSGPSRSTWASPSPSPSLQPNSQPQRQLQSRSPASRGSQDAFPALPVAPKPTTTIWGYGSGRGVRRDYGHAESSFQWGNAVPSATSSTPVSADDGEETKGKRGKKGKKVIVQWG